MLFLRKKLHYPDDWLVWKVWEESEICQMLWLLLKKKKKNLDLSCCVRTKSKTYSSLMKVKLTVICSELSDSTNVPPEFSFRTEIPVFLSSSLCSYLLCLHSLYGHFQVCYRNVIQNRMKDMLFYNPHDAMILFFSLFFLESADNMNQLFFSTIICIK